MAVRSKAMILGLLFLTLLSLCISAPPSRDLFEIPNEPSTSTQLTQGKNDGGNSIWDEDDDVFDLDGDSWLNQPSAPLSTWPTLSQSPKPPDFDDGDDDNLIDDESDDSDEEQESDDNQSEFLLVPASSVDKRDLKVRHAGRSSEGDLDDSNFVERPDDVDDDDKDQNYDLVSFPETDDDENVEEDENGDTGDNDIFGEEDDDDSKRMFEDRVFLF